MLGRLCCTQVVNENIEYIYWEKTMDETNRMI
jgi:hypothetical protein